MAQNDDEITIDFSAIKSWFKGKKPAESAEHDKKEKHHDQKHEPKTESHKAESQPNPHESTHEIKKTDSTDEDLSLDLSSLTSPFKKLFGGKSKTSHPAEHHKHDEDSKDEGIAISWEGAKKFIITYHLLFLLLVPMYIAYDLRIQTVDLPITEQWARDTINNNYRNAINQQIVRQYPNLPEAQRSELVTEQFNQLVAQQKDQIEAQIKNQAAYFKTRFNDEHGHTVLLDIDSYAYYRETWNLLTYKHPGNSVMNGTNWDTYIMAPMGVPAGENLHNYLAVWEYKIWKVFDKDIYLMKSSFYLPMIVYVLAIIPAFMIATYYGGAFGGVVAGIIVAVHPAVLTRTTAGVTDTDVYQIFFPLWVVWLYLESYRRKSLKANIIMSALAGACLGVYSLSWSGWWLIFYLAILASLIQIIEQLHNNKQGNRINLTNAWKQIQVTLMIVGTFMLFTGVFVTWLRNFEFFLGFITEPFAFLALKQAVNANLWPNVYTTVAELNPITFMGAMNQISFGSNVLLAIAVLGMLFTLKKRDEDGHLDVKISVLLIAWFFLTMWAAKSGVRFVELAVPPFALAVGAFFGMFMIHGSEWLKKHMNIPSLLSKCVIVVLLSLLLIAPVKSGYDTSERNIPLISDSWWQTLTQIRDNSAKDAIITSWWDFGHWFKAVADRPTTFDGGTQNTPIAHWVGKILLTSDEDQAVGILRMLNCGSFQATVVIENQGFATVDAVNLLYSVFNKTRDEAKEIYIEAGVKDPDTLLHYTHCLPPESFVITSADMVGKSGVWAHFGSWDFNRADAWMDRNNGTIQDRMNQIEGRGYTPQEAENLVREVDAIRDEGEANTWVAPWPSYGGGTGCAKQDETLTCQNGLIVNLTSMEVVFTGETAPIHGLVYVEGDAVKQKSYPKYSQDISVALVPAGESFNAVFMQYPLGRSMFTRLFYLEGHGLNHFKRFSDKTSVLGERIINWKVDWKGNETNVFYQPKNATEAASAEMNATEKKAAANSTLEKKNVTKAPAQPSKQNSNSIEKKLAKEVPGQTAEEDATAKPSDKDEEPADAENSTAEPLNKSQ